MKNKGYSLVELMLSIAVFSIMMLSIVAIMSNTMKAYSRASIDVDLQENAQVITNQIEELLCDAKVISGNASSGYVIDNKYLLVKNGKNLVLKDAGTGSEITKLATNVDKFSLDNWSDESKFVTGTGADAHDNYAYNQAVINLTLKNDQYKNSYSVKRNVYFRNNPSAEKKGFHDIDKMSADATIPVLTDPDEKAYALKRYETLIISNMFQARYGGKIQKKSGSTWEDCTSDTSIFKLTSDTTGSITKNNACVYYLTTGSSANKDFVNPLGGTQYRFVGYSSAADAASGSNPIEVNLSIPPVTINETGDNIFQWHSKDTADADHMITTCIPIEGIDIYNGLNAGSSDKIKVTSTYTFNGTESTLLTMTGATGGYIKKETNTYPSGPINEGLSLNPDPYTGGFAVNGGNPARSSGDGSEIKFTINIYRPGYSTPYTYNVKMKYDKMSSGF